MSRETARLHCRLRGGPVHAIRPREVLTLCGARARGMDAGYRPYWRGGWRGWDATLGGEATCERCRRLLKAAAA